MSYAHLNGNYEEFIPLHLTGIVQQDWHDRTHLQAFLKLRRAYLRTRVDAQPYLFISNRGVPIDQRTLWCAMQAYGKKAGLPLEKRKFHSLEHSIATHRLAARGELRFVQDWVGHKNVQNPTKDTQLTNPRREEEARKLFADHRVV